MKQPPRPILPQHERASLLAALAAVDYVVIFDEDTPESLINEVRPDILVKGEDWRDKGVVGRECVEAGGGQGHTRAAGGGRFDHRYRQTRPGRLLGRGEVNDIERWLRESARLKIEVAETQSELVQNAAKRIAQALREGNRVYLMGNGGSAADAQHIAGELINRFLLDRGPLPVMALTTDTSVITSVANDYGFAEIFSKQIAALVQGGRRRLGHVDVGQLAQRRHGDAPRARDGRRDRRPHRQDRRRDGEVLRLSACACPSTYTPWIQETHIALGHAICDIIERTIFEGSHTIGGF